VKATQRNQWVQRQQHLQARLTNTTGTATTRPLLSALPITYEIAERTRVLSTGGVGAIHTVVTRLKLPEAINAEVSVLKRHLPYWESDHVLSLCYNVLTGGKPLQDINRLRQDEVWLDAFEVSRLPAPSTAGDFLRRFQDDDIIALQEAINAVRLKVWQTQPEAFRRQAIIDMDGTISETDAHCKEGVDYCGYKRQWGYGPLLLSLAATREPLYVVNRPASVPSHDGVADWVERALVLVEPVFDTVWLRGDTDFSLTAHFDAWDDRAKFIFGYDAMPNLIELANDLPSKAWSPLQRPAAYEVKTTPRRRPANIKQAIVRQRGYKNLELMAEEVAALPYRPGKCRKTYRLIALRKHLRLTRGDRVLSEEVRYFFYITNDQTTPEDQLVLFIDGRCHQENTIEQLKNGVPAFHAPADTLHANWAYMVMAALAWNLKAWYGLLIKDPKLRHQVVQMEFKQFLQRFINIPCQIVRSGRRLIYRIVHFTFDTLTFFDIFEHLQKLKFP
jgi:hypothetical protein